MRKIGSTNLFNSLPIHRWVIAASLVASLLLAGCGGLNSVDSGGGGGNGNGSAGGGGSSAGLPSASFKQTPQEITFDGCPPEGDGGDSALNLNKNRVDEGNYQPTAFSAIAQLTWPPKTEKPAHSNWSPSAQAATYPAQGLPVAMD